MESLIRPAPWQPWKFCRESPKLSNGGQLAYDAAHHVLYSSNLGAGFWRVVTE